MFDHFLTEKQILRKLGGDKIPGKVLTFNGKPNPDAIVDASLVKLSEGVYDINSIERITVNRNGDKVVYDKSELVVQQGIAIGTDDETFAMIVPNADIADFVGLTVGLYIPCVEDEENGLYVEKIEFTETIVPIDQKYLPGVCLPVVELTGCVLGEAITDKTVITALNKCYAESPVIIGSIMTEGVTYLVFNKFVGMGFVASLMGSSIRLVVSDGNWTLSFE